MKLKLRRTQNFTCHTGLILKVKKGVFDSYQKENRCKVEINKSYQAASFNCYKISQFEMTNLQRQNKLCSLYCTEIISKYKVTKIQDVCFWSRKLTDYLDFSGMQSCVFWGRVSGRFEGSSSSMVIQT
jgi:hypothetical protein